MMELIDFTDCKLSKRNLEYAGRAGEKRGIEYNNQLWFLKFPKNTIGMNNVNGISYVTSPLSEYIGSNIFKILGYDVHDTILGTYNDGRKNKVVCACRDFIRDDKNEMLIPYTALRNDTNPQIMARSDDSMVSASNINEIIFQLDYNTILSNINGAKERFWDVVIIDMLINNNDRNEDNWGVIKYKKEDKYKLSPIYDCGNCFYSKTSEERIHSIMIDKEKLLNSALNGITAYENDEEKRITNKDILKLPNNDLKKAIERVYEKVQKNMINIEELFDSIPTEYDNIQIMSSLKKEYYLVTLNLRFEKILKEAYEANRKN